jgi:hypothetical protein
MRAFAAHAVADFGGRQVSGNAFVAVAARNPSRNLVVL